MNEWRNNGGGEEGEVDVKSGIVRSEDIEGRRVGVGVEFGVEFEDLFEFEVEVVE